MLFEKDEIPRYTLREAFKCYLDITTPVTQQMLSYCKIEVFQQQKNFLLNFNFFSNKFREL